MTVTIFEKSVPGRRAFVAPELDVPRDDDALPDRFRRAEPPRLPEIAEPEIVRHYTTLSTRNFHVDKGFYPLGSCTMKHNPKLHERVAALPGHARLHPLQDPEYAQGALELMWNLQVALGEIAGLPHVSLQPSAGSHGELAGLLLTRAYHEERGHSLVQLRVVLHRARAERIEARVEVEVAPREAVVVADDLRLGDLGQARRLGAQELRRDQLVQRRLGDARRRLNRGAPTRDRALVDGRRGLALLGGRDLRGRGGTARHADTSSCWSLVARCWIASPRASASRSMSSLERRSVIATRSPSSYSG